MTGRSAIARWSQRLRKGIQFPAQRNSEGKRKEVKRKIPRRASTFLE